MGFSRGQSRGDLYSTTLSVESQASCILGIRIKHLKLDTVEIFPPVESGTTPPKNNWGFTIECKYTDTAEID